MIYTVTLNPAVDYVMHLPDSLQQGRVNRAAHTELQFGGKGINVSCVLRQLGQESVALGFTAGKVGMWLEESLAGQGLRTDFICLPAGETRINVKLKAGLETDLNAAGPEIPAEAMAALYRRLAGLKKGDLVILAGSVPGCLPTDTYEKMLAVCLSGGAEAVVDAEGPLLEKALPYHPFLIKPNRDELGGLFGRELHTDAELEACAAALQAKGARNVLVSLGGDGALLKAETGETFRCAAPAGRAVNSVGAGDSMVAGFVAGWLSSHSWTTALRWGTAAGSATAFSEGLAEGKAIRALAEKL